MTKKQKILKELEPLFQEAEEKGCWFYNKATEEFFTPKELRERHKESLEKCINHIQKGFADASYKAGTITDN